MVDELGRLTRTVAGDVDACLTHAVAGDRQGVTLPQATRQLLCRNREELLHLLERQLCCFGQEEPDEAEGDQAEDSEGRPGTLAKSEGDVPVIILVR